MTSFQYCGIINAAATHHNGTEGENIARDRIMKKLDEIEKNGRGPHFAGSGSGSRAWGSLLQTAIEYDVPVYLYSTPRFLFETGIYSRRH